MIRFPTFRSTPHQKTAQESLVEILSKCELQQRQYSSSGKRKMPSSKGKPTDPKLREEVKEEVKQESKGGGPGSWSAWKAAELAKRYEAKGGEYENQEGSKNKPEKGAPQKKSDSKEDDKKSGGSKKKDEKKK